MEFLANASKYPIKHVCAVYGDEAFLKAEVIAELRRQVLDQESADLSLSTYAGKEAVLREVYDALATVSLFGSGPRMVIIEDADSFVSAHRSQLEDYVSHPAKSGVLVLDLKTFPGNTRLAKSVAANGLAVDCKTPTERQIRSWLVRRTKQCDDVRLEETAVDALLELVPPEPGVLVQEIKKLALLVDENRVIDAQLVRNNVGGWRTRTMWEMIDAAADGRAAEALEYLDRLIASGEKAHGLLPPMATTLRRFSTAVRLIEAAEAQKRRLPVRNALAAAQIPPFKLGDAERQLRQLGRERAKQLTDRVLAADLAMKGHRSSDERARVELETLIVRLAAQMTPQASVGAGRGV